MRTIMGMGRGTAATWPRKKRVKKKAMMAEGEKNMVAGRRMDERERGAGGFWRGGETIGVNWVEPAAYERTKK